MNGNEPVKRNENSFWRKSRDLEEKSENWSENEETQNVMQSERREVTKESGRGVNPW